jgi:hypothetical protein
MRTPNNRTINQNAIETAERNGAKMWSEGYTQKESQTVPGTFFVSKPDGRTTYVVSTAKGWENCDCEQWKKEGVCKHQYFVNVNRQEAEYTENQEMGKYGEYAC